MSSHSPIELLSAELFTEVLSHVAAQRDLNSLSRASRILYHRTISELYRKWSYHGLAKDPKGLQPWRNFLVTITWRPDLAAHVKELDLREWGNCPRLEDYVGCFWEGQDEREAKLEALKQEKKRGTIGETGGFWEDDEGDEADGEFVCESESDIAGDEDICNDETMSSDWDGEFEEFEAIDRSELEVLGPASPQRGEDYNAVLLKAGRDLGFENPEVVLKYANVLTDEDEDRQVVSLLMSLPNLQTIYMVMPEDSWHIEENYIHKFFDNTAALASHKFLQQLHTLYMCSPMHLGGKDHREYTLDLSRVLPVMRLPKLRNLYTLTAHCYNDPSNFIPINYEPLKGSGNLTTLVYDEAELPPRDAIGSLSIPKALEYFQWTGAFICYSIGTCYTPFKASLGKALQAHEESLKNLYLDIRYRFCRGDGHHANPFASLDFVRRTYSSDFADKMEKERGPKSAIMLGSLRGFKRLTTLAVNVDFLIGHQNWTSSTTSLVELLPPNLIDLTLFVNVSCDSTSPDVIISNKLFYSELLHLLQSASDKVPELRSIKLKLVQEDRWEGAAMNGAWGSTFMQAEKLCAEQGLHWEVVHASERGNTEIPYFMEQAAVRNPGRDF